MLLVQIQQDTVLVKIMIQKSTSLQVVDNSGAKVVSCISIGKGFNKKFAKLGDLILVSVKSLRNKRRLTSKVRKGEICFALIIRVKINKKQNFFCDKIKFSENSVILFTKQKKFLFTRIFGGVSLLFRYSKYTRIISLSSGILV